MLCRRHGHSVEREFINLSLTQLFLTRTTLHQEFPHTGEIWVNGQSISNMASTNDFTLTGSFTATQELCDQADGSRRLGQGAALGV